MCCRKGRSGFAGFLRQERRRIPERRSVEMRPRRAFDVVVVIRSGTAGLAAVLSAGETGRAKREAVGRGGPAVEEPKQTPDGRLRP
jgi:hypothetical protein